MSKDEGARPPIDPRVTELLQRHASAQEAAAEIQRRLRKVVDKLKRKFPGQTKLIRFYLAGQGQRLASEEQERIREERNRQRKP